MAALMRSEALKLAAFGFAVFPCAGKVPITTHGHLDASANPPAEWWPDAQANNIGISLEKTVTADGKVLFGIDIDPRSNGAWEWHRLVAGRDVPDTVRCATGRGDGGYHFYFYAPAGWKRFPKQLAAGVDVKASGYLIAPPSLHPESGEAYRWDCDPWSTPIADAPQWLLDELGRRVSSTATSTRLEPNPAPAYFIMGERNNMLASLAGTMRRRAMDADEIDASLQVANSKRCRPPLPPHEVRRIAESAERNMDAAEPIEPVAALGESCFATPILTGSDLAKPLPPPEYFVSRLGLPSGAGAPHLFGGFGFSGKTLVHQMLNLSLAAARNVWKAYEVRGDPYRITHVDNEQGLALTARRYQRGANAMGESLERVGDRLKLLVFPRLRNGQPIKLIAEHRAAWLELMTDRDLLCVDSLDATRGGDSKQSDAEVRKALDLLGELSEETKCRGSMIHHANKASLDTTVERDPRAALAGSQGIYAACDSVYLLSGGQGEAIKVTQIKARSHGEPVLEFALVITDIPSNELGDLKWGLAVHVSGTELIDEQRQVKRVEKEQKQLAVDAKRVLDVLRGQAGAIEREMLMLLASLNGKRLCAVRSHLKDQIVVTRVGKHDEYKLGTARY